MPPFYNSLAFARAITSCPLLFQRTPNVREASVPVTDSFLLAAIISTADFAASNHGPENEPAAPASFSNQEETVKKVSRLSKQTIPSKSPSR